MHVHSLHENREILAWPLKSLRSGPRREEEESAIMADDAPAGEVRPFHNCGDAGEPRQSIGRTASLESFSGRFRLPGWSAY